MWLIKWSLMFVLVLEFPSLILSLDRGIQVRLTRKVLKYAIDLEVKRLEESLKSKRFDHSGRDGRVEFRLSNTRIDSIQFPTINAFLLPGQGLQVKLDDASITVTGELWYKYRKGWVKISDTTEITARAKNVNFQMTIGFGADENGRPTIDKSSCQGSVGDIGITFHKGLSWIYNLFSGILESKLKERLNSVICESALKDLDKHVKPQLSTFPVSKKIDDWAIIDYRLMGSPVYTSNFIDIHIKGEFKDSKNPEESLLPFKTFVTGNDASRMVYFWLSEYTANTAGEVLHRSGKLEVMINGWDPAVPEKTRKLLNTKHIEMIAPSIYKKYPDAEMAIHLKSYKAPQCEINKQGVRFFIYARADLTVKMGNQVFPVFAMKLNVNTTVDVGIHDKNVIAQIKDDTFQYIAEVDAPYRDIVSIPLNSNFVYGVLRTLIVEKVNKKLKTKGLPLPSIGKVALEGTTVQFEKNALRISSDVSFKRAK